MSPPTIPPAATAGFANAAFYDAHRPSYPAPAIDSLLTNLLRPPVRGGTRILDLGAGTGKFTELLAERDEGFEIVAVEPHEGMRRELERKEGLRRRRVRVLGGSAAGMPLVGTGDVDAVVVAQAFHWFANEDALREIYRVLTPGGVLGMIWNVEDYNAPRSWTPTTEWESKLKSITWSLDDDHPRFRHEQWQQVFENQLRSTPFSIQSADPFFSLPLGKDSVEFSYWLSPEAVWERYHSLSQVAVLEGEELASVKTRVFEAMSGPEVEKNEKGEVALHGHTVFCWTSAVPGAPLKEGG